MLNNYNFINQLKDLSFVNKIIMFGSRACGDSHNRSDIDIAIECPQASDDDWRQVLDIVEKADTLLKIDCVRLDKASIDLKKHIKEEGVVIYERN